MRERIAAVNGQFQLFEEGKNRGQAFKVSFDFGGEGFIFLGVEKEIEQDAAAVVAFAAVVARLAARGQRDRVAVLVLEQERGAQIARAGVLAPVDQLLAGLARRLVDHLAERGAVDQVLEHDGARGLGDHRQGMRIPLGQDLPALDLRVGSARRS